MRLMAAARRIAHHDGPYRECDQPAGVALSSFTLASTVYRESGYFYHEPGNFIANKGRCKPLISAIWNDCQSGHATPKPTFQIAQSRTARQIGAAWVVGAPVRGARVRRSLR